MLFLKFLIYPQKRHIFNQLKNHRSGIAQRQGAGPPVPTSEKMHIIRPIVQNGDTPLSECCRSVAPPLGAGGDKSKIQLKILYLQNEKRKQRSHFVRNG